MTTLEGARDADAAGDLLSAAREYEEALREELEDPDVFLDLAVVYFELMDSGIAAALHLDRAFLDDAWRRANELLNERESRFGPSSEAQFWRKYFEFVVLGSAPFVDECHALLNPQESLVPYFYLWSQSGGHEFVNEAQALYRQVASVATTRGRYVRDMLRGLDGTQEGVSDH